MNIIEAINKPLTLIIWNTEQENDVRVYLGKLQVENGNYHFVNEEKGWRISLDDELLSRINPVTEDMKEILLNADYALSISMGPLPDSDSEKYNPTGMNWEN